MICVMLFLLSFDLMGVKAYIWPLPKNSLAVG